MTSLILVNLSLCLGYKRWMHHALLCQGMQKGHMSRFQEGWKQTSEAGDRQVIQVPCVCKVKH